MTSARAIAPGVASDVAPVKIRIADARDVAAMDDYVDAHSKGALFHRNGWAAAARAAYGFEDVSLIAIRGDHVVGVLPLIDVRARLLGRSLISTAYAVGGGPIGDDDAIVAALADEAAALGAARRVNYVELRSDCALGPDWLEKSGVYASFELALHADEDAQLASIPRRRRAEVRKAIKAAAAGELCVRYTRETDEFYALYAKALRNHGTPVFPKAYVDALFAAFSRDIEISIADYKGEAVAALLSFYDGDRVMPYYIGALSRARAAPITEYLSWTLMRRAVSKGCAHFDFGRSKVNSGPYNFKKLWGADPKPVTYRCKLIGATALPDVNPNNPKFAAFVSMWRRLPAPVANRLGPLLSANFP